MKDIFPKSSVLYCRETEVDRLAYTLKGVVTGFYSQKRFLILPYLPTPGEPSIVVLPRLQYHRAKTLIEDLKTVENGVIPSSPSTTLYRQLNTLLPSLPTISPAMFETWQEIAPKFFKKISEIWPNFHWLFPSLEIRPTSIGTISSWSTPSRNQPNPFIVYLRHDASPSHIAETILTALVRSSKEPLYASFETTEAMVDYLLTETSFHDFFPKYRPTSVSLARRQPILVAESQAYLKELRLPVTLRGLVLSGRTLLFEGNELNSQLTKTEEKILKILAKHRGEVISIDQLMDESWGVDSLKNIWAVSKAVDRLRAKLASLQIPVSILTIRSRGYLLQ